MATARLTADSTLVKPLQGAIVRSYVAGSAIAVGELVSMSSDGKIDPSDSTSAKNPVLGVALQVGADGTRIDVVVFGPVICLTGATVGAVVYNSTTEGEPLETVAGNQTVAGIAESASILFVRPASV